MYQITKTSTRYNVTKCLCISLLCSLLTACFQKTLPIAENNTSIDWAKRKQTLEAMSQWTLRGKAAFQVAKRSGSAAFEWQQEQNQFSFAAFNPLGGEEFRLQGNQTSATLRMANGTRYDAPSSEQLFLYTFGFEFPLSSLTYWVRGIPNPALPADTQFDSSHRLAKLTQANWQVDFENYTTVSGVDLPRFIVMTSPQYKAKVMIYEWKPQSSIKKP